jgi:hypothetical protein
LFIGYGEEEVVILLKFSQEIGLEVRATIPHSAGTKFAIKVTGN